PKCSPLPVQVQGFTPIPADDVRTKPPSSATNGVQGLLDENGNLRSEWKEQTVNLFDNVRHYLTDFSTNA
ncbi:MAG: hypothetical protein ACRER7_00510, partial [Gammaproteobacteria bacterium]